MNGLITRLKLFKKRISQIDELIRSVDDLRQAVGRIESRQLLPNQKARRHLHDYEFKVYSQWGEDGIIQFLINSISIANKVFVEFGVQDYKESNTRFLLQHDNWSGLVMDSSGADISTIKGDQIYWRNNLRAVCAFIERENINSLISENGISADIGLLSIDIDGNDYWIWEAINSISPRIVICEYDSILGCHRAVVTPYRKDFDRAAAHYSFLYGGASISALDHLARKKGYSLVGSNSAGNNAFFVRNDVLGSLQVLAPKQAYVKAKFRISTNEAGEHTFLDLETCRKLIADLPLVDIARDEMLKVRDIGD